MSVRSLLGLEPEDVPATRRLGAVIGSFALGDFLIEGVVTSAFLARVGAEHLPAALAARAVLEVIVSVGYGRLVRGASTRRALTLATASSALVLGVLAVLLSTRSGAIAAFVAASALARLKVIHFGLLALSELPGAAAPRALPIVYACARVGAIVSGPLLALASGIDLAFALGLGALAYAAGSLLLVASSAGAGATCPESVPFAEEDVPSRTHFVHDASAGRRLLGAIVVGAIALSVGRLALTTQSGAILQAHYDEAALAKLLGFYFAIANALGLGLQLFLVGRVLASGGLPILNTGWSAIYVVGQLLLALGPPVVPIALGARLAESELRNAARTPVANLLYEALAPERRAAARTLVIGVAIPLASLGAGVALALSDRSHALLSAVGVCAATLLLAATFVQNRAWKRALAQPAERF